jgi:hypothetical protein
MDWAGLTMSERVELFHAKFPQKLISQTALRNLYTKNGIKRKAI